LNPFEIRALDHLAGELLDLGCGLGNLSLEAARRGCRVTAVDGSPTAIERIREASARESLEVVAVLADLDRYRIGRDYDTIVAIGLLMFLRRERALELLAEIRERVRPGGRAIVNVLVEGTTYWDLFDPDCFCLFGTEELRERFSDFGVLDWRRESFPAPRGTVKVFTTIVAEKPA
jgi:tellurite methyltransferase